MTTPMRKQYLQIKKRYPGTIVFFRLGDFYETFDEDAQTVSRVCDIVLTSRPVSKGQRVPMAGVPYHAVEGYIAKLINAGHRVAIVEQVREEAEKGLMPREVLRVVTPGTVVEPGLLEAKKNNYLAAIFPQDKAVGLAYADITTGEFAATQWEGEEALLRAKEELSRLHPAESLIPSKAQSIDFSAELPLRFTPFDAWRFEPEEGEQTLLQHFRVASLEGYGLRDRPLAIGAAGAILHYLNQNQPASLRQIDSLRGYFTSNFMALDPSTRRNLELIETIHERKVEGSLFWVLDATLTAMGGRLLRQWLNQPLLDLQALNQRLDAVQAIYQAGRVRIELREALKGLRDLERLTSRAVQGIAGPRDLLAIKEVLETVPTIKSLVSTLDLEESHPLQAVTHALDPCPEGVGLIARAIADDAPPVLGSGNAIAVGYSTELDALVKLSQGSKEWLANLETQERARTGIKSLKVRFNKVFGYYIEVSQANLHLVPADYIRKQTLVGGERFITPELKEYEAQIFNAQEIIRQLEFQIFTQVLQESSAFAPRLMQTARALAQLDVFSALAEVAVRNRYTRPILSEGDRITVREGRHPVVELTVPKEPFVPNDCYLSSQDQIILLTGPNMAGKSTYLRQVALIVLMAQIGSFVPAEEAEIGLVDRIFTRIGAREDIASGQSTFMVEMIETAHILHQATEKSLLILDEIGRGTSTYDGISIAWAVVEYIHNHSRLQAKTLFATHYHELTELADFLPRVKNFNVAVVEEGDQVIFLRHIVPGGADRSYGIHVARLAGIPKEVINRAQKILVELEKGATPAERAPHRARPEQLALFLTEPHPLLKELESLNLDSLSPLDALSKLHQWQKRLKEDKND
ncbi:MAG: DNA mismatch repair protein MutS [Chloroflexi bacterium]|nr:DNA mismatch repair protein MutS [Chloroflexota bacterium]